MINNGIIVGIRILPVLAMRPLTGRALRAFKLLVSHKGGEIVAKWIEFFVHHRPVESETITRRLK